jgi:hypothetical protein
MIPRAYASGMECLFLAPSATSRRCVRYGRCRSDTRRSVDGARTAALDPERTLAVMRTTLPFGVW